MVVVAECLVLLDGLSHVHLKRELSFAQLCCTRLAYFIGFAQRGPWV